MKLKEFIKELQEINDKYPNLDIIHSVDEGYYFDVTSFPIIGYRQKSEFFSRRGDWDFWEGDSVNDINSVLLF